MFHGGEVVIDILNLFVDLIQFLEKVWSLNIVFELNELLKVLKELKNRYQFQTTHSKSISHKTSMQTVFKMSKFTNSKVNRKVYVDDYWMKSNHKVNIASTTNWISLVKFGFEG